MTSRSGIQVTTVCDIMLCIRVCVSLCLHLFHLCGCVYFWFLTSAFFLLKWFFRLLAIQLSSLYVTEVLQKINLINFFLAIKVVCLCDHCADRGINIPDLQDLYVGLKLTFTLIFSINHYSFATKIIKINTKPVQNDVFKSSNRPKPKDI